MSDREKLLNLMREAVKNVTHHCSTRSCEECAKESGKYDKESGKCKCSTMEMIADHLLANGVTVQKWIPVSERLPERDGTYMVHASVRGHKYIDCVSFAQDLYRIDPYDFHGRKGKSGFYTYDNEYGFGEYQGVTHWMPLPTKPKGE